MLIKLFQICCLFSFLGISHAVVTPLQTGQQDSYTPLDDGELQTGLEWPVERFRDHKDGTLTDNLTGLMWIKKANCARHYIEGASTPEWHQIFDFVNALNNNSLHDKCEEYTADYNDWRAPNIHEIASLMRAGLNNQTTIAQWLLLPGSESGAFASTSLISNPVWTANTFAGNNNQAWIANLETGGISIADKFDVNQWTYIFSAVRSTETTNLVATGQKISFNDNDDGFLQSGDTLPIPRFVLRNDKTVVDKATGLIWLQDATCANQGETDWTSAMLVFSSDQNQSLLKSNCLLSNDAINQNNPHWRMPNINELRSLVDYGQSFPALDLDHPFSLPNSLTFWSSTSANTFDNITAEANAWTVAFNTGEFSPNYNKLNTAQTWPVSGPISFADIQSSKEVVDFGSVFSNSSPITETITLSNSGSDTLVFNNISLVNTSGEDTVNNFSIVQDNCVGLSLTPKDSCTLSINFSASNTQNTSAILNIFSNALGRETMGITMSVKFLKPENDESNPACFIATAAYGSPLASELDSLREFRNKILLTSDWGKEIVNYYYQVSPPIALYVEQSESLKAMTRILLTPIVYGIKYPVLSVFLFLFMSFIFISKRRFRSPPNDSDLPQ